MRKFNISVNGKSYEVDVEEVGGVSTPAPAPVPAQGPGMPRPHRSGQRSIQIHHRTRVSPPAVCSLPAKNPAGRKVPPSTAPMGCALLLFPVKAGPAASPLVCASGFDKLPLNNITQFGEKRKWEPPSFHAVPTFFHVLRGSRAVSSGALRPAAPAAGGKTPAAAPAPPPPADRPPPPDGG